VKLLLLLLLHTLCQVALVASMADAELTAKY
jgi:hypothetical protein